MKWALAPEGRLKRNFRVDGNCPAFRIVLSRCHPDAQRKDLRLFFPSLQTRLGTNTMPSMQECSYSPTSWRARRDVHWRDRPALPKSTPPQHHLILLDRRVIRIHFHLPRHPESQPFIKRDRAMIHARNHQLHIAHLAPSRPLQHCFNQSPPNTCAPNLRGHPHRNHLRAPRIQFLRKTENHPASPIPVKRQKSSRSATAPSHRALLPLLIRKPRFLRIGAAKRRRRFQQSTQTHILEDESAPQRDAFNLDHSNSATRLHESTAA